MTYLQQPHETYLPKDRSTSPHLLERLGKATQGLNTLTLAADGLRTIVMSSFNRRQQRARQVAKDIVSPETVSDRSNIDMVDFRTQVTVVESSDLKEVLPKELNTKTYASNTFTAAEAAALAAQDAACQNIHNPLQTS